MTMTTGWDVGGAHLKAALIEDGALRAVRQLPCPLWRGLDQFDRALETVLDDWPMAGKHAVTLTGEMVDLFPDRANGVATLSERLTTRLGGSIRLFAGRHGLVDAGQAGDLAADIASANWRASAMWIGRRLADAVLIDIGSTTTDIIAIALGRVATDSISDADRLAGGELVYTGTVRTPVCALADRVPWRSRWQTLCNEFFATAADVHRLLEQLPEGADLHETADGRGKSVAESTARLARMLGLDAADGHPEEWRRVADHLARRQLERIRDGLDLVLSTIPLPDDAPLVGAGIGRFLVERLALLCNRPYHSFGTLCTDDPMLQAQAADCAPAVAVGLLASA
jgi:(4-(4-[2-(gamma-L-glutamylamino)ethyl]phenoxymethyl)furan-2-yl)methanamine synthase